MAASFEYAVPEDSLFAINKKPIAVPGEVYARSYSLFRPSSSVVGQTLSAISTIQWSIANPSMTVDLANSFIAIKAKIVKAADGTPYVATDAIAPELGLEPFGVAQFMIGSTSVESTSSLLNETTYTHRLLSYSANGRFAQGQASLLGPEYGLGAIPANNATYPPANNGAQSTSVTPLTTALPGNNTAADIQAAVTGATTVATYNPSFEYRRQVSSASREFSFVVHLRDILSFVQPGMIAIYGQTMQLTLQPAQMYKLLMRSGTVDGTLFISDISLWLHNVTPSAAVSKRLLTEAAEKKRSLYQYVARDSLLFQAQGLSFSQSFTIPMSNPQWVVLRFLPNTFTAQTNAYQCSLPPNPVVNDFPFSTAYLQYNGDVIPSTSFGSAPSDLVRAYQAFCEAAGQTDPSAGGAAVAYSQFIANHFLLCFYLGSRKVQEGPAGSMSGTITLQLTCNASPTTAWNVIATYYGVKATQIEQGAQGLTLINIS